MINLVNSAVMHYIYQYIDGRFDGAFVVPACRRCITRWGSL